MGTKTFVLVPISLRSEDRKERQLLFVFNCLY